ncbi:MAG: hypothetical protein M2R46_01840 [Verrucomicrobia subdivision 3 bacterium]|nr:hypothetical protein [Limisphaerales bacterium]
MIKHNEVSGEASSAVLASFDGCLEAESEYDNM